MIEKLPFETKKTEYEGKILTCKTHTNPYDMQVKINELVDAVNGILAAQEQYATIYKEDIVPMLTPKNEEPAENAQDENPRCPFCGEELFYVQEIDGGFDILTCNCSAGFWLFGNDKMWYNLEKATTELDRTRKALDVALCSLQNIAESDGDFITGASTPLDEHEYADMMLKEIKRQMKIETALEQKDVKNG